LCAFTSFEAITAVMFQVEVFRVLTPCSVVVGYRRFRRPRCLHLHNTARRHNPEGLDLKCEMLFANSITLVGAFLDNKLCVHKGKTHLLIHPKEPLTIQ